jgi:hypothetical protein
MIIEIFRRRNQVPRQAHVPAPAEPLQLPEEDRWPLYSEPQENLKGEIFSPARVASLITSNSNHGADQRRP